MYVEYATVLDTALPPPNHTLYASSHFIKEPSNECFLSECLILLPVDAPQLI